MGCNDDEKLLALNKKILFCSVIAFIISGCPYLLIENNLIALSAKAIKLWDDIEGYFAGVGIISGLLMIGYGADYISYRRQHPNKNKEDVPVVHTKKNNRKTIIACIVIVLLFGICSYGSYQYGYDTGKAEGYTDGKSNGYNIGKLNGYRDGKSDGYDDGYSNGYYDAYEEINSSKKTYSNGNSDTSSDIVVYVTDTGSMYHTYDCQYLWNSCNPIYLSDAKSQGYSPCSKCNPPW